MAQVKLNLGRGGWWSRDLARVKSFTIKNAYQFSLCRNSVLIIRLGLCLPEPVNCLNCLCVLVVECGQVVAAYVFVVLPNVVAWYVSHGHDLQ